METPKNDQKIVFGVVIAIIAILVIAIVLTSREAREYLPDSSSVDTETREVVDPAELQNFDLINAKAWDRYENASEDILVLGEDQEIAKYILQDPQDDNIFYFITNNRAETLFQTEDTPSNHLSVYRYTYDEYSFERIYRAEITNDSFLDEADDTVIHFDSVGLENNKLVLLVHPYGPYVDSPCHPLLVFSEQPAEDLGLVTVDLEDPYAGLSEYSISGEVQTQLTNDCDYRG
jgi:hypothetical protein